MQRYAKPVFCALLLWRAYFSCGLRCDEFGVVMRDARLQQPVLVTCWWHCSITQIQGRRNIRKKWNAMNIHEHHIFHLYFAEPTSKAVADIHQHLCKFCMATKRQAKHNSLQLPFIMLFKNDPGVWMELSRGASTKHTEYQ